MQLLRSPLGNGRNGLLLFYSSFLLARNVDILPRAAMLDKEGKTMKWKETVPPDDQGDAIAPQDCLYLHKIKIKFYLCKPLLFLGACSQILMDTELRRDTIEMFFSNGER